MCVFPFCIHTHHKIKTVGLFKSCSKHSSSSLKFHLWRLSFCIHSLLFFDRFATASLRCDRCRFVFRPLPRSTICTSVATTSSELCDRCRFVFRPLPRKVPFEWYCVWPRPLLEEPYSILQTLLRYSYFFSSKIRLLRTCDYDSWKMFLFRSDCTLHKYMQVSLLTFFKKYYFWVEYFLSMYWTKKMRPLFLYGNFFRSRNRNRKSDF